MTRSNGLSETILRGKSAGGKRRWGRQKKTWADNIEEWTGKTFVVTQLACSQPPKNGTSLCSVHLCSDPTTLVGYGQRILDRFFRSMFQMKCFFSFSMFLCGHVHFHSYSNTYSLCPIHTLPYNTYGNAHVRKLVTVLLHVV